MMTKSKQMLLEVLGQKWLDRIRQLSNQGLTPHQVGHQIHAELKRHNFNAHPYIIRAVAEVAGE